MELRIKENIIKKQITKRQTNFNNEVINNENDLEIFENQNPIKNNISNESLINDSNKNTTSKITKNANFSKNIHKDHRNRLKTQFLNNGITALTDIQKLELLLFYSIPLKDTNPLAHKLIDEFGSLKNVFTADYEKLIRIDGVKENTATLIKFISSLNPILSMPVSSKCINTAYEAKEFCSKLFVGVNIEQFYVICLSKNNQIQKYKLIQSGSADEVTIQIRNITELALNANCNRIIITHNHPYGDAIMSDEDCSFTYALICSCMLNSIEVIDHIIIGNDNACSLASQKILQKLKERAFKSLNVSKDSQLLLSSLSKEYILDDSE